MDKRVLLITAFIEGGLVMLLEISSPLVVSPILGHSVDVWAILISLSIGGLALGYFIGAYLTSKGKSTVKQLNKLFLLAGISIFSGWLLINLNNDSNQIGYENLLSWITLLMMLFLPSVFFGATSPILININNPEKGIGADLVGKIYSFSTLGGIFFSIICGYFLIPIVGLRDSILLACLLTFLIPSYLYFVIKLYRISISILTIIILCIVLISFKSKLSSSKDFEIINYSEGINGQLIVADIKNSEKSKDRILFINRMGQTWVNLESGFSVWSYPNFITSLASLYPQNSKSLVLGLGGGIVCKQLSEYNKFRVDAVEIDPRIIEIAKNSFGLKSSGINLIHDDARHYIKTSMKEYDFIVLDIFNGEIAPSHGLSVEAFQDINSILSDNGMIVINFNGFITGKEGLSGRSLIKTIRSAGFNLKVFPTIEKSEEERNNLFIAYKIEPDWNKIAIHVDTPKGHYKIKQHFLDLNKIAMNDAIIITDDFPIMEHINKAAANKWRESYLKNFTLKFKKEYKVPLVN